MRGRIGLAVVYLESSIDLDVCSVATSRKSIICAATTTVPNGCKTPYQKAASLEKRPVREALLLCYLSNGSGENVLALKRKRARFLGPAATSNKNAFTRNCEHPDAGREQTRRGSASPRRRAHRHSLSCPCRQPHLHPGHRLPQHRHRRC